MICRNCGTNCDDNVNFCISCGSPLTQPQQPNNQPYNPAQQFGQPQQPYNPAQQPYNPAQQYGQPQQQPYNPQQFGQPQQPQTFPGKGLGIASMVIGIIALVLFCWVFPTIICGIIGVVLGGIGISKAKSAGCKNGMAVAGIVCSIVALALLVIFYFIGISSVSSLYYL